MILMMLSGVRFEMVLVALNEWKDYDLGWDKNGEWKSICWMVELASVGKCSVPLMDISEFDTT